MSFIVEMAEVLTQELRGKGNRLERAKMLLTLIALLIVIPFALFDKNREEKERQENLVYHKQMESLDEVEANVKDLMEFVKLQKEQLRKNEDIIADLKTEEQQLRPVVTANRSVVNAILDAQTRKNRANIWKDRIIAFGLGVLASLIASILFTAIRKVAARRREVR